MPTSQELLNTHFEKNFGGYKTADVDSYVEDVRTYISQCSKDIADLKRQLLDAQKKASLYTDQEESIKKTLLNAQVLADKITKEAKEKAEEIINNANETAESKTRSAKIKIENLVDCAQSEVEMRKKEAETIKTEVYNFKLNLMKLYRAQLELISEIPAEEPKKAEEVCETEAENAEEKTEDKETETSDNSKSTEPTEPADTLKETKESNEEPKAEVKPEETLKEVIEPKKPIETKLPVKKTVEEKVEEVKKVEPIATPEAETAATAPRTVKLNLRYNETTGEYEPLNKVHNTDDDDTQGLFNFSKGKNGDGLKFGADYNIRTDSFDRKN